jgi:curli biogenesis system outer membrane secretion channel CsgG
MAFDTSCVCLDIISGFHYKIHILRFIFLLRKEFKMVRFQKQLIICSLFFILTGCVSGTTKKTQGPSVSEAQKISAIGPKARIVVAQFVNNTAGYEAQMSRAMVQVQAAMPDMDTLMAYQGKMMEYQATLMQYQARLNEVGTKKAGPPPKAPQYPKASTSPYMKTISDPIAGGVRDMLINSLFNSNRFIVLERQSINEISWEQEFSHTTRVGSKTKIPIGQIESAELMLIGSLNTLEAKKSGGNIGGIISSVLSEALGVSPGDENLDADASWESAATAMEIRLVDTRTSRVVAAATVEGTSTNIGFGASHTNYSNNAGTLPKSFSMYHNTPVEDALTLQRHLNT